MRHAVAPVEGVWKKSSFSGNNGCVEVTTAGGEVAVRDSKDPDGPRLYFGPEAWRGFVNGVREGDFDLPE